MNSGPSAAALSRLRLTARKWLGKLALGTFYIEPGSPWENGYGGSSNGSVRDGFLSLE